jgi:hypothetical protein
VVLEVSFTTSDQLFILHGQVYGMGQSTRGTWLEFSAPRALSGLQEAVGSPKRRQRRVPTDYLVNLIGPSGIVQLGRLLDVSTAGARIGGVTAVTAGEQMRVRLLGAMRGMPSDMGVAHVTWARSSECGVKFDADPFAKNTLARLVQQMQSVWDASAIVVHPDMCHCVSAGDVFEPLLPHAIHRAVAR